MLAATAMGLRLCGIFAQKQKPPAYPHSFHTIPYSMKGLTTATLVSMHPAAGGRDSFCAGQTTFWRATCLIAPTPLTFLANAAPAL